MGSEFPTSSDTEQTQQKRHIPWLLDIHTPPRSQEIKHLQLWVLTSALHGFPPRDGCNCKSSTMWQKSSRNRRSMKSAETNHQTAKIHILLHTLSRIPKTWKLKIHKARGGTIERISIFLLDMTPIFLGGGGDCFCPVSFEIFGWEFENPTRQVNLMWVWLQNWSLKDGVCSTNMEHVEHNTGRLRSWLSFANGWFLASSCSFSGVHTINTTPKTCDFWSSIP